MTISIFFFFFSSRRRHTRCALVTWSSDVCSSDLCAAIRARRRRTKQIINVSANAPTCSLWLVPRVAKYSALNKKVQIRVSAIEGEPNLRASELDVAIVRLKRVGMVARRSSYHDTFLMGERVFPVCAPALLRKLPGLAADPNQLSKVQLLQEENTDTPRSAEHTSELQSLMRISYAVFC